MLLAFSDAATSPCCPRRPRACRMPSWSIWLPACQPSPAGLEATPRLSRTARPACSCPRMILPLCLRRYCGCYVIPGLAANLGKNGREYVASEFSFQRMIREDRPALYGTTAVAGCGMSCGRELEASVPARYWPWIAQKLQTVSASNRPLTQTGCAIRSARVSLREWGRLPAHGRVSFSLPILFSDYVQSSGRFFRKLRSRSSSGQPESASIVSTCWVTTPSTTVSQIDWHCDRVHGKCAPRKPWFRVKYLDFAEVGDSKVTWELNRHQHLVTLAKAYRSDGRREVCLRAISPVGRLAR